MITNRPRTYPSYQNGSPPDAVYNDHHPATQQTTSMTTAGITISDVRNSSPSVLGFDHPSSLPYTCLVSPTQTSQPHMVPHAASATVYGDPFLATSSALGPHSLSSSWSHSPVSSMRSHPLPFDSGGSTFYSKRQPLDSPDFHQSSHVHPRHQNVNEMISPDSSSYSPYSSAISQPQAELKNQVGHKAHLRFNIVLQASTAVTQRSELTTITYLNRSQLYVTTLADRQGQDCVIRSSYAIMFHDPSHRKVALNYWKFWIGQQKHPHARAIDLDPKQSTGIANVQFPSFDRITFDWNGRQGAKIYVRFNCLSTDFSRIKGVKGIPLRAYIENEVIYTPAARSSEFSGQNTGTFLSHSPKGGSDSDIPSARFLEKCYCKIKLFRDKGAERKNKDDIKQIGKQFEKMMYGMEKNPPGHPMWLVYNQPQSHTIFDEVPSSPSLEALEDEVSKPCSTIAEKHHSRVMTAPTASMPGFDERPLSTRESLHSSSATVSPSAPTSVSTYSSSESVPTYALPFTPSLPLVNHSPSRSAPTSTLVHLPQALTRHASLESNTPPTHLHNFYSDEQHVWAALDQSTKRSHRTMDDTMEPSVTKRRHSAALSLFVDSSTTQSSSRLHSPSTPSPTGHCKRFQRIDLARPTVKELVDKLCSLLSLHTVQVSDVVWRKTKAKKRQDDILILVEDDVILEQFPDNAVMTVEWEIKANGTVRLLLQF